MRASSLIRAIIAVITAVGTSIRCGACASYPG
jgi:hypothetical protein